jgi:hypothetical protein
MLNSRWQAETQLRVVAPIEEEEEEEEKEEEEEGIHSCTLSASS